MNRVRTGIDVLVASDFAQLAGRRVGLMTNPSGVDATLTPTVHLLHTAPNVNLVALFGPEHGVNGLAPDGEKVADDVDPVTDLPVYSLYGSAMRPTPESLADLDLLVCDIQDVGVRFYTYLWTISHILEGCGEAGVPVMILDRPNPIGGAVAGRGLESEVASFVGRYDIPIRHGMTLGELAQYLNATVNPTPAEVEVIACEGYTREMLWADTGLPFVPPSPAMPNVLTALHYPGACFVEGTTLSEGRGTTIPFQIMGAPYIAPEPTAQRLNALNLPGVRFRPHRFEPLSSKYEGEVCGGVQAHIADVTAYEPISIWLHVIHDILHHYPDEFGWRPPYRNSDYTSFDKLIGSTLPRQQLSDGESVAEVMEGWAESASAFEEKRQPYLLYPTG
jgi:uncharacterized protein YbbC (DUF1343 family)